MLPTVPCLGTFFPQQIWLAPLTRSLLSPRLPCCLAETPLSAIEEAFKNYTSREDVAIVLITQTVAKIAP